MNKLCALLSRSELRDLIDIRAVLWIPLLVGSRPAARRSCSGGKAVTGGRSTVGDISSLFTERLALDPIRSDDADAMVGVLADPRLHEFTGGHPLGLDDLRRRFQRLMVGRSPDGGEIWLNWIVRLRSSGAAVGTVQASVTETAVRRAAIAWIIGVPWQRRGIASEAASALVGWLGRQGIQSISASVHPRHLASQKVAARAGLVRTNEVVDGEEIWRRPAPGAR
jgi:RimJ/RimL family protein N-acetyltransferase